MAWQIVIFVASLAVLMILGLSLFVPLPAEIARILQMADLVICLIFMADFGLLLYLHENRKRYLLTWGWIDFLSSIPFADPFRWGRLARVVRLFQLFRGLRGSSRLLRRLFLNKQETTIASIILGLVFVSTFSSVAILIAEEGSQSNIDTAEEALWWTLSTMTTVGYGDMVPATGMGRFVGIFTMFAGIGVFGAFTALIASLLVKRRHEETTLAEIVVELKAATETMAALQAELRTLKESDASSRQAKGEELV